MSHIIYGKTSGGLLEKVLRDVFINRKKETLYLYVLGVCKHIYTYYIKYGNTAKKRSIEICYIGHIMINFNEKRKSTDIVIRVYSPNFLRIRCNTIYMRNFIQ